MAGAALLHMSALRAPGSRGSSSPGQLQWLKYKRVDKNKVSCGQDLELVLSLLPTFMDQTKWHSLVLNQGQGRRRASAYYHHLSQIYPPLSVSLPLSSSSFHHRFANHCEARASNRPLCSRFPPTIHSPHSDQDNHDTPI